MTTAGRRACLLVLCVLTAKACSAPGGQRVPATATPAPGGGTAPVTAASRIVSLVPSVTEALFAVGAGPSVVGVSSFDTFPPEVAALPKVGALVDPDSERILSLRPDLIVVYGSQVDERARFESVGIRTYSYRHGGIEATLASIEDVGRMTGREASAATLVSEIRARLTAVAEGVRGRPRPKTVLVFDRPPATLQGLYASGGIGVLHEMLDLAGGENVFRDVEREAVQPSHELLIARAPEVVLEISAQPRSPALILRDRSAWEVLASVPAVRTGRVVFLAGDELMVPGPRLAAATETLARALHPDAIR